MRCSCYIVAVWLGVVFTGSAVHAGRLVSPAEGQVLDRLPIQFEWETSGSAYAVILILYHEQEKEPRIISVARSDRRCRVDGLVNGKYRWNVLDGYEYPLGDKDGRFELRLPAPSSSGKPKTSSVPAAVSELSKAGASPATVSTPPLKTPPPAQKPPANPPAPVERVSPPIPNVQPPSKPAPAAPKPAPGPAVPAKPGWSRGTKVAVAVLVICALNAIGIAVIRWLDSRKRDAAEYEYRAPARGLVLPPREGSVNPPVIRIQQSEAKAGHLERTVTALETKVTHIEEALSRLQHFLAKEHDRLREDVKGYVPAQKFEETIAALEAKVGQSRKSLQGSLHPETGQDDQKIKSLQERLAARQERLTARQERLTVRQARLTAMQESLKSLLSEKRATVLAACNQVDAWIEQLKGAVPRETTMLLTALTRAGRAETLPQLRDTSQQLLSEIYASVGGAALRNRTGAVKRLQEIRDMLEQLSGGNDTGIQQKVDRLQAEAEKIFSPYANGQSQERLDPDLAERTRRMLIKELGMPYVSIVMGRYAGNAVAASALISDVLHDLGLDLIQIVVGQTRPEKDYHEVQANMPATDKCASGTIANVVKMGYVNQRTREISPAQVFVAQ